MELPIGSVVAIDRDVPGERCQTWSECAERCQLVHLGECPFFSRSPVVYANDCSCSSTNVGNFRSIGNSVLIFVSLPKLAQTTSSSVAAHEKRQ